MTLEVKTGKDESRSDKFAKVSMGIVCIVFALVVFELAISIVDSTYFRPLAAEVANKICQERGFDQQKGFEHVQFSTVPLGVQCEYAPRSISVENQK